VKATNKMTTESDKPATPPTSTLNELVASSIRQFPQDQEIELFRNWFQKKYQDNLAGLVFFGSCLSEKSKSATSFKDFIAVVYDYRKTSRNPLKWLSHWTLPPDLFHLALEENGRTHECKYYLISTSQLLDSVSDRAKDLYLLGRLSKRIAVIHARDQAALELLVRCQTRAMQKAAEMALAMLDSFDLENFIKAVLRLSYLSETRLEDERKIDSLYEAHRQFYEQTYGMLLREMAGKKIIRPEGEKLWRVIGAKLPVGRRELEEILAQSRKRAKARWPKMIITVDNWLDQLLAKLERTYGIKLEIPAWERPVILITGWRHYFRLKRQGKIH